MGASNNFQDAILLGGKAPGLVSVRVGIPKRQRHYSQCEGYTDVPYRVVRNNENIAINNTQNTINICCNYCYVNFQCAPHTHSMFFMFSKQVRCSMLGITQQTHLVYIESSAGFGLDTYLQIPNRPIVL